MIFAGINFCASLYPEFVISDFVTSDLDYMTIDDTELYNLIQYYITSLGNSDFDLWDVRK